MSLQTSNPRISAKRQTLTTHRDSLLGSFSKAATARKRKRLAALTSKIAQINELLDTLDQIEADLQPKPDSGIPRFAVSSLFVHESFRKLTADPDEQFFFITGTVPTQTHPSLQILLFTAGVQFMDQ